MTSHPQAHVAEAYVDALGGDRIARNALLACAAGLRLDDGLAGQAIELVAGTNGSTAAWVRRIKRLACVWQEWDGTWFLSEEVRAYLGERLHEEVPAAVRNRLHGLLSEHAAETAARAAADGQITVSRTRAAEVEAGYQRALTSEGANDGAELLANAWRSAQPSAKDAICTAVSHLTPALARVHSELPDEVRFLRGMAAYRRDDKAAERDLGALWEHGRPGDIYGIAAHLFGKLVGRRQPKLAERALNDSLEWHADPHHQAQVWHSLGNHLSRDRSRFAEAETAFRKSLELRDDPHHRAQVWHSLGKHLSQDRSRFAEAETAFRKSLELRDDPHHRAQVWHSLGKHLSQDRSRFAEAETAFRKSLELRDDPHHRAQVQASWAEGLLRSLRWDPSRTAEVVAEAEDHAREALRLDPRGPRTIAAASLSLVDVHEIRGELEEAAALLEEIVARDRKRGHTRYIRQNESRIFDLRQRLKAQRSD